MSYTDLLDLFDALNQIEGIVEKAMDVIEDYRHKEFVIGETLVDVDKQHITAERAIEKIRKVLRDEED